MSAESAMQLVPKTPDLMDKVMPIVSEARSLVVVTKDDVEIARSMGKSLNALISEVEATFQPIKRAQDAAKKITLEQEKKHLAPLQEAKGILANKMSDWDQQERARIAEEQRRQAQEEERKRQLALENARRKLDKLMAGMTDDKQILAALYLQLDQPETTPEEAELLRAQIRTIEARIATTVERAQEVEQKVEEVSQPTAPVQNVAQVKTATGVSQEKVITGVNMRVFLRWLSSEECTILPESVVKIQDGTMKSLVQKMNMPGVSWKWQAKTRF